MLESWKRESPDPVVSYVSVGGVNLSGGSAVCPCLFPEERYLQHTRTTGRQRRPKRVARVVRERVSGGREPMQGGGKVDASRYNDVLMPASCFRRKKTGVTRRDNRGNSWLTKPAIWPV